MYAKLVNERKMKMGDLKAGDAAVVLEGGYMGVIIVKDTADRVQMIGDSNGWTDCSLCSLAVRKLTPGELIES